ncbi:hypothetical protein RHMOL_Rhmol12G0138200 [Rhododendron molle]|uniref:Uncharacterized protein n=1 Tax=Rhododendron molle TaxID=49168 RepID=A0ACC0LIT3_RHOML|nr:hypothetical protein RHMOL_Rhmol12G0138200 [Rhododendron molle]
MDQNMKAYKPHFVSFGPYHHGDHHSAPMEEHKHCALLHFLKGSNKPLKSYVNSLAEVAQSLKDSYELLDLVWERNTNRFLQMMIVDGCFMIEVLPNFTEGTNDYADSDSIFSNNGKLHIVPYIQRDMLMLENQLPMLVLITLLAVESEETKKNEEFVNKLILKFCCRNGFSLESPKGKCLHLLDVHRKILLWEDASSETKRHEHGGDKEQKDKKRKTESKTSNGGDKIIRIIDSAKDFSLLHDEGIIQNALGSDKAVAELFNSISKDATLDPASSLDLMHKKVDKHCRKTWNKWKANLKNTYFRNPWSTFSFAAAILLFVLTILQTIFTIWPSK